MATLKHLFSYINHSFREGWDSPALTDYGTDRTYTYGDVATQMARLHLYYEQMARLHLYYEQLGLHAGDKIAVCGVNSSNWAVGFLSILSYNAVAVSVLADFTGADIEKLVNHSDAQVLFVGPMVEKKINISHMPALKAVISTADFHLVYAAQPKFREAYEMLDDTFQAIYPQGFKPEHVHYREDNLDDLALINYTSGTTSNPKGVMLTYRSLSSNVQYSMENMECHPGINLVSLLPLAHMFGMMQKQISPVVRKPLVRVLWHIPGIGTLIKKRIRKGLMDALGGNIRVLISGGAAINPEVEKCLMDIHFPYLTGYGMTECGPLVCYVPWQQFKAHSCGRLVDRMELRIDSPDRRGSGAGKAMQSEIVGEIQLRGDNCMVGYYKNPEATKAAFTEDGWMHTGDLGCIDAQGNVFLRGRCKTMILGPSGQNIYPEEIESLLNAQPAIDEALVVSRDNKLHALIYLTDEHVEQMREEGMNLQEAVLQAVEDVNRQLPSYSRIANFEFMFKEFEKTPKRSIKRYLYQ